MARPDHLFVFAYDVEKDGARAKLAQWLEERATRVQKSVFEGRMTAVEARTVAAGARRFLGPEDGLRVYCITEEGRAASLAIGDPPLAEPEDFWIL